MEKTPIQVTTKDPKKVEAGKRLAEYNRKQREELKELKSAAAAAATKTVHEKAETVESTADPVKTTNYEVYGIIGIIAFGGIVYYIYHRNKPEPKKFKSPPPAPKNPIKSPSKFDME